MGISGNSDCQRASRSALKDFTGEINKIMYILTYHINVANAATTCKLLLGKRGGMGPFFA